MGGRDFVKEIYLSQRSQKAVSVQRLRRARGCVDQAEGYVRIRQKGASGCARA